MKLRTLAFAAMVPVCIAFAHDFGNNYDSAPMVSTSTLELQAGKPLTISSNAIHWRPDLFAAVKSGTTKQFFNGNAWYRKVATAKVASDITLGGLAIGAGDWTVYAKVPGDDTSKFFLEWKNGDKAVDVPLDMKGGNDPEDHLLLALTPRGGAQSKEFQLKVFYGDMKATVAGSFGGEAK